MKYTLLILLFLFIQISSLAKNGDTTIVPVFDKYLFTWHGSQIRNANFTTQTKTYSKILMRYKLTCPNPACGEWDYTTNIYLRDKLGVLDSSLAEALSFDVNGVKVETFYYTNQPRFKTFYNSTARRTDSALVEPSTVRYYRNTNTPFVPTDSVVVYQGNFTNYYYSQFGGLRDSVKVGYDSMLTVETTQRFKTFEKFREIEIGRVITPYGFWFSPGREFYWDIDVTDYAPLFNGNVDIRAFYDGWSQGSLFSLDFIYIEGTPFRTTKTVDVIYSGNPTYGDPANPPENVLIPYKFGIQAENHAYLRVLNTGHGFGGTENAAEFSDKTHSILVNAQERYSHRMWNDDCGQNPVYPQAGTWYYNRSGWCPGQDVKYKDFALHPFYGTNDSISVQYKLQPYTNANLNSRASYIIQNQLIQTTPPVFAKNVEVTAIVQPTTDFQFSRINPICAGSQPKIKVKNYGSETVTSMQIEYGTASNKRTENWTGTLPYLEETTIEFPTVDLGTTSGVFTATVRLVNGSNDEYPENNEKKTSFTLPGIYYGKVALALQTDDVPNTIYNGDMNGIRYQVVSDLGSVLLDKTGFADNSIVRDTFSLQPGCYYFVIYDEGFADGLIPIFQGSVRGAFSLRDQSGTMFYSALASGSNFKASFGDREIIPFTIGTSTGIVDNTFEKVKGLFISPNPSSTIVNVSWKGLTLKEKATVVVRNIQGQTVFTTLVNITDAPNIDIDIRKFSNGPYYVSVVTESIELYDEFVVSK